MTSTDLYIDSTTFLTPPHLHNVDHYANWNLLLTPDFKTRKDVNLKKNVRGKEIGKKENDSGVDTSSVFDTSHKSPGVFVPLADRYECHHSCGWLDKPQVISLPVL